MNAEQQTHQKVFEWLDSTRTVQYAATVHLTARYRSLQGSQTTARRLQNKLNSILWRGKWRRGNRHLAVSALYAVHMHHDLDDRAHLHIAFDGIPDSIAKEEFLRAFYKAAQKTAGVQFYWKRNELWHAERVEKEFGDENAADYYTRYRTLTGSERLNNHHKQRMSVYVRPCDNSSAYLHYMLRRVWQGSPAETIFFDHMQAVPTIKHDNN